MWFKRKPKNRRLGREFVLDVKLRSSQVRATRMRMAAVALGVVFAAVFGVYVAWRGAQWGLSELVYENNAFAIREIDVQTDGVLPVSQLRRWAGVKHGDNLLALDMARVKRDLEMVSWIESVSVERVLPHTLRIRVAEREPLARINVARPRRSGGVEIAVFYLDADGWAMAPEQPGPAPGVPGNNSEALPVISGVNGCDVQAGRRIALPQVQAALHLLSAFERSSMNGLVDLKRIDVLAADVLVVTTGQGSEVIFGLADYEQPLRRWQAIFDVGQRTSKAIATLDLAVSNNVPVRWLEASAVPPVPGKAVKPLRTRKKHV